jgi:hypothetical protein
MGEPAIAVCGLHRSFGAKEQVLFCIALAGS